MNPLTGTRTLISKRWRRSTSARLWCRTNLLTRSLRTGPLRKSRKQRIGKRQEITLGILGRSSSLQIWLLRSSERKNKKRYLCTTSSKPTWGRSRRCRTNRLSSKMRRGGSSSTCNVSPKTIKPKNIPWRIPRNAWKSSLNCNRNKTWRPKRPRCSSSQRKVS